MYTGMTKTFLRDLALARHNLAVDDLMCALYTTREAMSPDVEFYTTTGECTGANYPAGGLTIVPASGYPLIEGEFFLACRFDDLTFSNVTLSAGGAMIYNASVDNRVIACLDFGQVISKVASPLEIAFAGHANPIIGIRIPGVSS